MTSGVLWSALAGAVLSVLLVLPTTRLTRGWTRPRRMMAQGAAMLLVIVILQAALPWLRGGREAGQDAGLDAATLEAAMFQQVPAFRTVARREPALWRQALDQAAAAARGGQASGAAPGAGPAAAALQAAFSPLLARLAGVAVGAGDDAVLRWAVAEQALNGSLMLTNAVQCGRRVQNSGFRTDLLGAAEAALLAAAQDAKVAAYEEGLRASAASAAAAPPDDVRGAALAGRAVTLAALPLPADEAAALADLAAQPPELACRAWVHFSRNMLALPQADAAALARFALGPAPG